jgi:hypothetical protein
MKLFKLLKIFKEDKKYGYDGRYERAFDINTLLRLNIKRCTKPYITPKGETYVVNYCHGYFFYDSTRISLKNLIKKLGYWHVQLFLVCPTGGVIGFEHAITNGITKKSVYKWLREQALCKD